MVRLTFVHVTSPLSIASLISNKTTAYLLRLSLLDFPWLPSLFSKCFYFSLLTKKKKSNLSLSEPFDRLPPYLSDCFSHTTLFPLLTHETKKNKRLSLPCNVHGFSQQKENTLMSTRFPSLSQFLRKTTQLKIS